MTAHDPETIEFVRGAVARTLAGKSIYSTVQWLDAQGAPLPRNGQGKRKHTGWTDPARVATAATPAARAWQMDATDYPNSPGHPGE